MSLWESYSTKRKDHKLKELIDEVDEGEMPLKTYSWIHGTLSKHEREIMIQWATLARLQYRFELKVSSK